MSSEAIAKKAIPFPITNLNKERERLKSQGIVRDNVKMDKTYSIGIEKEVAWDMDENKLLEKYLDKVDQDRREQEQRLNSNMEKMEERLSKEKIASEERLEKLFNATMESIKDTNNKIDKTNEKLDNKIDGINNKIDSKVDLMYEKIDSTNKWIIGTCIATILAVAAIAVSAWF